MTAKDEFIETYIRLDKYDRELVDEYISALLAGDKAKCDRMMQDAHNCGSARRKDESV